MARTSRADRRRDERRDRGSYGDRRRQPRRDHSGRRFRPFDGAGPVAAALAAASGDGRPIPAARSPRRGDGPPFARALTSVSRPLAVVSGILVLASAPRRRDAAGSRGGRRLAARARGSSHRRSPLALGSGAFSASPRGLDPSLLGDLRRDRCAKRWSVSQTTGVVPGVAGVAGALALRAASGMISWICFSDRPRFL
jgi:hypothetical protein